MCSPQVRRSVTCQVRRSVTRVMRRVKEIRSGSPISMAPLGHPRTKLLAAAAPFLDDSQRQELDDFTATHLKFASRCSTPAGGVSLSFLLLLLVSPSERL